MTWSGTVRAALVDSRSTRRAQPADHLGRRRRQPRVGRARRAVRPARSCWPSSAASPARFAPYVDLYHRALAQFGKPPLPVGVHSPGFIAETDDEAADMLWPHYEAC